MDTWTTNCEACSKPVDKLDQDKGIYIVGGSDSLCSIKCVKQILGVEQALEVYNTITEIINEGDK